ncbi:hypothetical protein HMPREF3156_02925 [Neisseria sp. HMSC06F02]|nr:hypothetical protein HMPREF3156_02925 [Neisseria sp. HMSC06F02]
MIYIFKKIFHKITKPDGLFSNGFRGFPIPQTSASIPYSFSNLSNPPCLNKGGLKVV